MGPEIRAGCWFVALLHYKPEKLMLTSEHRQISPPPPYLGYDPASDIGCAAQCNRIIC